MLQSNHSLNKLHLTRTSNLKYLKMTKKNILLRQLEDWLLFEGGDSFFVIPPDDQIVYFQNQQAAIKFMLYGFMGSLEK